MSAAEQESCMSIEETVALLRQHAFTVTDEDASDAGRTLIHSRLGGIGADWDLDDAVALAERAQWRGWIGSLLGHDLGVEVHDSDKVRLYAFDVRQPRLDADGFLDLVADTIACLADGGWVVKREDAPWDEAVIEWAQQRASVADTETVDA
jgi:hypothetical protein